MLMTISRAQMGSQLKGNKMYKKSSVGSMLAETIDGKNKLPFAQLNMAVKLRKSLLAAH
jgi:hypothetical protein